jgi:hypothetical protein
MKLLILNIALLYSLCSYSQISGVVFDKSSNSGISFANIWVEDENIGTTTNELGAFTLEKAKSNSSKNLVVSAIGYENYKIKISSLKDTLYVNPKPVTINKSTSNNKPGTKKIVIEKFDKSKIDFFYGSGNTPWMVGRYFPFEQRFNNFSILKSFKIHTRSAIDEAKINVRIYKKGKGIALTDLLHEKNIIAIAKRGNNLTTVDVSSLNISIPEDGFFIVLEWLIIDSNKKKYKTLFSKTGEKIDMVSYGPMIGALPVFDNNNSLVYRDGKWKKPLKTPSNAVKRYRNKYSTIAMELTLSN